MTGGPGSALGLGVFFQAWATARGSDGATLAQVIRSTQLADQLGYDIAWFTEQHAHLFGGFWGRVGAPHLLMAHLAGRTSRIGLGAAVRLIAEVNPVRLAEETVTLEHLAGPGRVHLGIGAGMAPGGDPAERERRRSAARCHGAELDALLRGQAPDRADQMAVAMTMPQLADRVYVATTDAGQIEQAARLGQGMLVGMFGGDRHPSMVRDFRSRGGRGPVRAVRLVYLGPDDATAARGVEPVARKLWAHFTPPSPAWRATKEQMGPHPPVAMILEQFGWIVGGPDTVASAVNQYANACGLDGLDLAFHVPGIPDEVADRAMAEFAATVVPRVQAMRLDALLPGSAQDVLEPSNT